MKNIRQNPIKLAISFIRNKILKKYSTINSTNVPHKDASSNISAYSIQIGKLSIKNNIVFKLQQILFILFLFSCMFMLSSSIHNNYENTMRSINLERISEMLMHAQRLAKSVSIIVKDKNSFTEIVESEYKVENNLHILLEDNNFLDKDIELSLNRFVTIWKNTESATENILKNKDYVVKINDNYNTIEKLSDKFLDSSNKIHFFINQNNLYEFQDATDIVLIANRILYNMYIVYGLEGANANNVFSISKDLISFEKILKTLSTNIKYVPIKEEIQSLNETFNSIKNRINGILDIMPIIISVKKSQDYVLKDSEVLRNELSNLQRKFSLRLLPQLFGSQLVIISAIISILSLLSLLFVSLKNYKAEALYAHKKQQEAENNQQIEQQKNSINQKAIIKLMNELQEIANGNLTQKATVDANITGSIADFINYTVEELKGLVQRVQSTANQATEAFNNVQTTSLQLLSNTSEQYKQIEGSTKSIENIAQNMDDMAVKTEISMIDAQDAIKVTKDGQIASQMAINGMQAIRVQIQDTSKHIKRLGESSLQISEITDLIENITQQTHILAINAAIQAANAGDAGRGFSVIAQEIQNLAEKSAQATKQIAQLINTIQTDVQSAGSAMEYSIQGVVDGSQMTDAVGNALIKIQETNQKLVEGMEKFSIDISKESNNANNVSENIKQLLAITEQTLQGTTRTSESIKTLSNIMKKLEQSVSRFTIH